MEGWAIDSADPDTPVIRRCSVWQADPDIPCLLIGAEIPASLRRLTGDRVLAGGHIADLAAGVFDRVRLTAALKPTIGQDAAADAGLDLVRHDFSADTTLSALGAAIDGEAPADQAAGRRSATA